MDDSFRIEGALLAYLAPPSSNFAFCFSPTLFVDTDENLRSRQETQRPVFSRPKFQVFVNETITMFIRIFFLTHLSIFKLILIYLKGSLVKVMEWISSNVIPLFSALIRKKVFYLARCYLAQFNLKLPILKLFVCEKFFELKIQTPVFA